MKYDAITKLSSYIDALRPIIYINHFDFDVVDDMISQVTNENTKIYEYSDAGGYIDFNTKISKGDYDIEQFLSLIDDEQLKEAFIVLKDIHYYLDRPKVIARLRSIASKTLYKEDFHSIIFIVSSKMVIPDELAQFITILDIPHPSLDEIKNIILDFGKEQNIKIREEVIDELALSFKGLNKFEITQILNLAYINGGFIDSKDKDLILQEKEQIIKKTGMVEIVNFKESIDDIGGLEKLKKWLIRKEKIFKQLDKAIKFGVDIMKGIMIIGMPGCGKSLSAKAVAKLFGVPLLRLDVGKLFGKYVGESEENMRRALKIVEAVSPCVLWVDEIEKAFAGIGESGSGNSVTTRLFGHFLTWLQEKESTVFVVATANDISKLPPEFLRKGRFDELFAVDLPNAEERMKIFEIHLKKRNKWNKDIDTIKLIKSTEGFSGADIESVVKESIENAFISNKTQITTDDLLEVIKVTKSLSQTLKEKIDEIRKSMEKIDIKPASEKI